MDSEPYIVNGIAWENGARVRVVEPELSTVGSSKTAEPVTDDERREIRESAIRDVLQFLASENDVKRIGWRCALAHWLIFRGESQQQLADRLGVSGGAISQALKAFRLQITLFLQGNDEPRQSPH